MDEVCKSFLPTKFDLFKAAISNNSCRNNVQDAQRILPIVLNITFNGENPEILQNGIKIIRNFFKESVGAYKCIAFNREMEWPLI